MLATKTSKPHGSMDVNREMETQKDAKNTEGRGRVLWMDFVADLIQSMSSIIT